MSAEAGSPFMNSKALKAARFGADRVDEGLPEPHRPQDRRRQLDGEAGPPVWGGRVVSGGGLEVDRQARPASAARNQGNAECS
jgi:hypothetical protein